MISSSLIVSADVLFLVLISFGSEVDEILVGSTVASDGYFYIIVNQFRACIVPSFLTCRFSVVVYVGLGRNLMYNSLTALPSKNIALSDVLLFSNRLVLCHFKLLQVIELFKVFPIFLIHAPFDSTIVGCGDEIHFSSLCDLSIMVREAFSDDDRFTIQPMSLF